MSGRRPAAVDLSRLLRLNNPIRDYPWGSSTLIPQLMGRKPDGRPEAELWISGHPAAPSQVEIDGGAVALDQLVAKHPEAILGKALAQLPGHQPSFPFLLKILAAAKPLSIQTHPTAQQARAGFERENRQGLALDDARRCYRDPLLKDELVCAFAGNFPVLSGLRPRHQAIELMRTTGSSSFEPWIARLATGHAAEGYRYFLGELFGTAKSPLDERTLGKLGRSDDPAHRWVARLAEHFPGDAMATAPLFLNLVDLAPGQALVTGAGTLHSYLGGIAIELMTPSDNVLRGGLTSKHVDRPELLRILSFEPEAPSVLSPAPKQGVLRFASADLNLALDQVELVNGQEKALGGSHSAEVVLVVAGQAEAESAGQRPLRLGPGDAILVPAAVRGYRLTDSASEGAASGPDAGSTRAFRAWCKKA